MRVMVWLFVNAAYPADLALDRKHAWWWVEGFASCGFGSWIARRSMLWVTARSIALESEYRFCWFQVPMQMSDVKVEGGVDEGGDMGAEGKVCFLAERVCGGMTKGLRW